MRILSGPRGAVLVLALLCAGTALNREAGAGASVDAESLAEGKAVAFDRRKGNCLACHAMDDGDLPGNVAPPLVGMQSRYPDSAKLRAQIWDATVANPNTMMPPFGRHGILSEEEIDKVTEYIHSL